MATQMKGFNSVVKNQLSFNKMIETQIAQLVASCPNTNAGKLPRQPEAPHKENVSAITTRSGKSTRDPSPPKDAGTQREAVTARNAKPTAEEEEGKEPSEAIQEETSEVPRASKEYYDTTALPFPERRRKPVADEQFGKFVEVIKKLYVNIPLLDAMQVPTYAKYLKDIIGKKRSLPATEMVRLTEECSSAIFDPLPKKKKDPGCPTISCSIGNQHFNRALCVLGASVSVMPKVVYDKLNHHALAPTAICLQLVDQSIRYPARIVEDIPVKICDFFVPVDFIVLDMEVDTKMTLILGRSFLSTAKANIDVGAGEILLNINGQKKFTFKPKVEQCAQVKAIDRKPSRRGRRNPSIPTMDEIIMTLEAS